MEAIQVALISLYSSVMVAAVSPSKQEIYCGGCQLLINEVEHSVASVDPKKVIEVGSFRVDPKGNQKLTEVPYARTELHLHELVEKACDKSKHYGYFAHPTTKRRQFVRISDFDGRKRKIETETSDLMRSKLRFACESIVEEHEDDLMKLLSRPTDKVAEQFCIQKTSYCQKEDFVPFEYEVEDLPKETDSLPKHDLHEDVSEHTEL